MTSRISDLIVDAPAGPLPDPPCPLPPELRSDVAYRRAYGSTWEALGAMFRYRSDALRRACENDPEFAAALDRARAEEAWAAEAEGLRRLRALANGCDDGIALKASEILVKYARERRRDDTRLACERLRADTRLAAAAARAERRASPNEGGEAWPMPVLPAPETEEERQKRLAREHAERAAAPAAEVYVWGGKHKLGRSHAPDETDTRVRLMYDASCGVGQRHGLIYWVVPESVCPGGVPPPVIDPT